LRTRQVKNFIAPLTLLSVGTPMLLAGDEVRSFPAWQQTMPIAETTNHFFARLDPWSKIRRGSSISRNYSIAFSSKSRNLPAERFDMTLQELPAQAANPMARSEAELS